MSETISTSPETLEQQKIAEYIGGKIEYSVVGKSSEHNPVILIPGFTVGRLVQRDFAITLSEQGEREVIFSEQPTFTRKPSRKPAIDRHAEALLAIIEAQRLENRPVDFIAHSFGSIVFSQAAELAKERGLTSFDSDKDSHAVFIAAAGTNDKENIVALGSRFAKFMWNGMPLGKKLDPDGEWMKAGTKNFIKRPVKTGKEINVLRQKEKIYTKLGEMGIKPAFLGYPSDDLMPFASSESIIMNDGLDLLGYSVPIDYESRPLTGSAKDVDLKKFIKMTGLTKDEAVKEWVRHPAGAGHNDFLFNPKRTVGAILYLLDKKNVSP